MTIDTRMRPLLFGLLVGSAACVHFLGNTSYSAPLSVVACSQQTGTPVVVAKAAYVLDVTTGTALYEKADSAQLPLASLTKLMTVDTALEILGKKGVVTITPEALTPEGDSGLSKGERWEAESLAHFSLIESSNDGAHALGLASEAALGLPKNGFVDAMNRRARALGLTQTYFLNDTGLDQTTTTAGAYGSAHDVAHLIATVGISSPSVVERSAAPQWRVASLSGTVHDAKNTALLASLYASAIASKTGYTDLAGGNMAFLFEPIPGRPVSIAVLGSTREGRIEDAETLANFAKIEVQRIANCTNVW